MVILFNEIWWIKSPFYVFKMPYGQNKSLGYSRVNFEINGSEVDSP